MHVREQVVIFGGGLLGGAAASAFSQTAVPVTVVTRAPAPQAIGRINWQYGVAIDVCDEAYFADTKAVVYAAGSMTPGSRFVSVHQVLTDQLLPIVGLAELAARAGVETFVFISSGGTVYGPTTCVPTDEDQHTAPINAYGMIKVQTEQALLEVSRRTGMRVVILRVANPYGPAQRGNRSVGFIAAVIEAAQAGTPVTIWGDGLNERDYVYLADVAEAMRLATQYAGESTICNVGSGTAVSLLDICSRIGRLIGRDIAIEFAPSRQVDVRCSMLDIRRAATLLDWAPRMTLDAGLRETLRAKNFRLTY